MSIEAVEEPLFDWARVAATVEQGLLLRSVSMHWCRQMGKLRMKHSYDKRWHGTSNAVDEITRRMSREADALSKTQDVLHTRLEDLKSLNSELGDFRIFKTIARIRIELEILSKEWDDVTGGDDQYFIARCFCTTFCCNDEGYHTCEDKESCVKAFALRPCRCGTFRQEGNNVFVYPEACVGGAPSESDSEESESGEESAEEDASEEEVA